MSFALLLLLVAVVACLSPASATLHTVTDADYECTAVPRLANSTAAIQYQRIMCDSTRTLVWIVSFVDVDCTDDDTNLIAAYGRSSGYLGYACPSLNTTLLYASDGFFLLHPLEAYYSLFSGDDCGVNNNISTTAFFSSQSNCAYDRLATKQRQLSLVCLGNVGTLTAYNNTNGLCTTLVSTDDHIAGDCDITDIGPVQVTCVGDPGAGSINASTSRCDSFNLVAMAMLLAWASFGW